MRHGLQGYAGQRPTGPSDRRPGRPVVAVVGAGAAGTLTAIHLVDRAARERRALDIVLLDPRPDIAPRGRLLDHRPAPPAQRPRRRHERPAGRAGPPGRLAARPRPPGRRAGRLRAPRRLRPLPRRDPRRDGRRHPRRRRASTDVSASPHARPVPGGVHLVLAGGSLLAADAVVLAPGIFAPGTAWAPAELRASDRFVADPWAPGALDALDHDRRRRAARRHRAHHGRPRPHPRPARPHPARRLPPRPGARRAHHAVRSRPPRAPSPELAEQRRRPRARPTSRRCAAWCATASPPRCARPATGGRPSTPSGR